MKKMTKTKLLILIFILTSTTMFGQKIKFLGVDSTINNYKGCFQTSTSFEYTFSEELDKQISVGLVKTETSYYLFNRFSVGGQLFLALPRGERFANGQTYNCNTFGVGFSGVMRWEFVKLDYHSLFVESGLGMIFTVKPFPPMGTFYNFTPNFGLGTNVKLNNITQLTFGYRWQHFSNGTGIVPTNPSYNGNGIFLGFRYKTNRK